MSANQKNTQSLKALFEGDYPGKLSIFENLIKPVFVKANDATLTPEQLLLESEKKQINSFEIISQVRGGFPITFADVEVKDSVHLKTSRVAIRNCVLRLMQNNTNAIIFFHFADTSKEWRISFVHKGDTLKDATTARRYTYLCGQGHSCRTVADRFETLKGLSVIKDSDLLAAFSVEPISNAFFEEYREHYADLVEYISGKRFVKKGGKFVEEKTARAAGAFKEAFGQDDKAVRDYVKKFMGRLVFLQFLQKKGWLGVPQNAQWGEGDKNFIANLYKNASEDIKKDFLEKALEPLFFDSLNNDRTDQNDLAPSSLCNIYGAKIRIPYLNGGLFESDALDTKKVKFKKEDIEALLEFFGRYNFTIDESDSEDTELGVDPEMLGKIFENLLEDNKDKGAFYTPKEIVEYMCRESLIAYLENENSKNLGGGSLPLAPAGKPSSATPSAGDTPATPPSPIRTFVQTRDASAFTLEQKTALLASLCSVKICDPAVGSGAFPMGILTELYALRTALGDAKSPAQIKKEIVKQNIYGVDIEKGAVDIARLRFWLSIIVDEDAASRPQPLPNLDYKIMQGNSLLESFEGIDLSHLTETETGNLFDSEDEIQTLLGFLTTYYDTHEEKNAIRDAIKASVLKLLNKRGFSSQKNTLEKLAELDLHQNSQFFLWHTWFNDVFSTKGGFDIVIGNPPYISAPTQIANTALNEQRERIINSKKYKSLYQKWDLYIPFIELGTQLNCQNGITSMIVPFPLTNQLYAKVLRKMITEETELVELVDLNGTKIFESATVSNCIPFIKKTSPKESTWISNINEKLEIKRVFEQKILDLVQDPKTQVWNVTHEKRETNRHADMHVLGDFCYVSYGLRPNSDEKTAKGEFKKEDLISNIKDNVPRREYIEAKDIEKYRINRVRYLEYGTERSPKKLCRPTFDEWFNPAKLFFNRLGDLVGTVDYENRYLHNDSIIGAALWKDLHGVENKSITSSIKKFSTLTRPQMEKLSEAVDLKYLLGIMNSSYASVLLTNLRGGDYHIYPEHIRKIPIPTATKEQQQKIITLVDAILDAKKQNPSCDTTAQETAIDKEVYALYGLTPTEIATVQGKE